MWESKETHPVLDEFGSNAISLETQIRNIKGAKDVHFVAIPEPFPDPACPLS